MEEYLHFLICFLEGETCSKNTDISDQRPKVFVVNRAYNIYKGKPGGNGHYKFEIVYNYVEL